MTALNGKHNGLHSNIHFDRVQPEIRKPELVDSGLREKNGDLGYKSQSWSVYVNSNISESPNFHNRKGDSMIESGFIQLPRSLLRSEEWRSLRGRQQKFFLFILDRAQIYPYIYKYNGKDIHLKRGDLCNSYRGLAEDFNRTVKFREEKIDASFVQRAVSAFLERGLTDTRNDTDILVISVTYPGIFDDTKIVPDTPRDTGAIQRRYTNEERKKSNNIKETNDTYASVSLLSNFEKEEKQNSPSVFEPTQKNENPDFSKIWEFAIKMRAAEGYTPDKKPGITEKDLANWLKIYEVKEIEECIRAAACATISKSYGGYINSILRDKIHQKKDNIQINNEFLKEVFKNKNCSHLENHKQYVTDNLRRTDYQKNSDPKLFQEMINVSLQMVYIVENHEENENY